MVHDVVSYVRTEFYYSCDVECDVVYSKYISTVRVETGSSGEKIAVTEILEVYTGECNVGKYCERRDVKNVCKDLNNVKVEILISNGNIINSIAANTIKIILDINGDVLRTHDHNGNTLLGYF